MPRHWTTPTIRHGLWSLCCLTIGAALIIGCTHKAKQARFKRELRQASLAINAPPPRRATKPAPPPPRSPRPSARPQGTPPPREPSAPQPMAKAPSQPQPARPAPRPAAKTQSFQIPLTDLNCQGCRLSLLQMVKKYKGVSKAHIKPNHQMCIHFDKKRTSPRKIMARATSTPIQCLYEKVRSKRVMRWPKGADVKQVKASAKGKKQVPFKRYLARGKVTIFDFYADWCGPCKTLDRWMRILVRTNDKLAIRKINVDHWGPAFARRFLKRCGGLPYLIIYNRKGKRSAILKGFDPSELAQAIAKAM